MVSTKPMPELYRRRVHDEVDAWLDRVAVRLAAKHTLTIEGWYAGDDNDHRHVFTFTLARLERTVL